MMRSETIGTAYRASSILRLCARSLDGDMPNLPGDNEAAADALDMARDMLGDVIEAMEAPQSTGDVAALYEQWKAIRARLSTAVEAAGGDDPETPEHESLSAQEEALARSIAEATPQTDADAAAMLEWCMADSDGAIMSGLYTQAQRAVAAYLRGTP